MKLDGKDKQSFIYVINIIGTDPPSLGSWEDFQCFSEFGASGRARTMKIGRRIRALYKLT